MKFLLFNLVVIGALFYIFAADESDKHRAAAFLSDTKAKVGTFVENQLSEGNAADVQEAAAKPAPFKPVLAKPVTPPPAIAPKPKPAPVDQSVQAMAKATTNDLPTVTPAPIGAVEKATLAPKFGTPKQASPSPRSPVDDAATARRAEILTGIDAKGRKAGEPVLADGTTLMPTSERQRALRNIAEDMELFYAQTVGQ